MARCRNCVTQFAVGRSFGALRRPQDNTAFFGNTQTVLAVREKISDDQVIVSQFPSALDLVVKALQQIRADGENLPRASRLSLYQLHQQIRNEPRTDLPLETSGRAATAPRSPASDKGARLGSIRARVIPCTKCPHLAQSRTQTVFGVGNPEADLMFIGEAPGADEDRQGEPFVGRAGQLLTKIIETMGFKRSDVYIANVLKCRPDMPPNSSGNRPPTPDEMQTCLPYLAEQIDIIQPKVLVALGVNCGRGIARDTRCYA